MPIRKILTPVQDPESAENALAYASMLAQKFKAHIDVLHVVMRPQVPTGTYYPMGGAYVAGNFEEIRKALIVNAATLRTRSEKFIAASGVALCEAGARKEGAGATAAWRQIEGLLPFDISAAARVADITVIGRGRDGAPDMGVLEEVIFQSGRPVLVPAASGNNEAPRRIAIAWNGSREAARALAAATPFIEIANAASVVTIGDLPVGAPGPKAATELLHLHGAPADIVTAPSEKSTEDQFMAAVKKVGADLVVMGGYSHSRWRELVLGGFTRALIQQSELPVLLAH